MSRRRIEELGLRHLAAAAIPPQAKQLKHNWGCLDAACQAAARPGSDPDPRPTKSNAWGCCLRQAALPGPQANKPLRVPRAAASSSTATTLRRSGRVANLHEQPNYRETNKKKAGVATIVERSYAFAKAKELEGQLGADNPTFMKTMTYYSATSSCLPLPVQFCREHLPDHDKVFKLVDEEDEEFDLQYHKGPGDYDYRIAWKSFAIDHKLDDGDCVAFQLIEPKRFKFISFKKKVQVQGIHYKSKFLKMTTIKSGIVSEKNEGLIMQLKGLHFCCLF